MTYAQRRYGFDSLRLVAPGTANFALGVSASAVTGSVVTLKGVIHHIVVELPQSAAQTDSIELHDTANVNLVGASTLVAMLKPWGATTTGSYTIPIHRQFRGGMVVRTNAVGTANFTVMYAPSSMQDPGWVYVR